MLNLFAKLLFPVHSTTRFLKIPATFRYNSPSPLLRLFCESSSRNSPLPEEKKLSGNRTLGELDLRSVPKTMGDACLMIGHFQAILDVECTIHTTLKLLRKINGIEKFIQPENISIDVWNNKSQLEKWEHLFRHPEYYDCYEEFIDLVKAFNNNDPKTCAELVVNMYSALNSAIELYVCWRSADDRIIGNEKFRKLMECFDEAPLLTGKMMRLRT